jgi:hypothetical protein
MVILSIDVVDGISSVDPIRLGVEWESGIDYEENGLILRVRPGLFLDAVRLNVRILPAWLLLEWREGSWQRTSAFKGLSRQLMENPITDEEAASLIADGLRSDSQHAPFVEEKEILAAIRSTRMAGVYDVMSVMES